MCDKPIELGARRLRHEACKGPNSALMWAGPSQLNGEPIIAVVTGINMGSKNPKIGKMAQVWIVPQAEPRLAVYDGRDAAVCGDCKHRPTTGKGCYVVWRWGPQQAWYTWRHNRYTQAQPRWLGGRYLRVGAWGDPAAVPLEVWTPYLDRAKGWTGYTHQWRNLNVRSWGWLMASVDTDEEYREARALGWRTFRIRAPGSPLMFDEVKCPAAPESPSHGRATCANCRLCNGFGRHANSVRTRSVAIVAHGQGKRRALNKPKGAIR